MFVGLGFMAFMSVTTLAIDVGMLMTAKTQAQTAADASALAGATALAFNSASDYTSSGPAVQSAINAAIAAGNGVVGSPVSINASDVSFQPDPVTGTIDRVKVAVYRTAARSNPVPTLIGSIFGIRSVDIGATATAETIPANAENCIKPWAVPDKWIENTNPPWDGTDTFNAHPLSPTLTPDGFVGTNSAGYSGYNPQTNAGTKLTLTSNAGTVSGVQTYFRVDLPGSSGAGDFQNDIDSCHAGTMQIGDTMTAEPLNMKAATKAGVDALVAQDPSAYYDTTTHQVVSSQHPSPRVVVIPLYDPLQYQNTLIAGHPEIVIADFMGFFIESADATGKVTGWIVPIAGLTKGAGTPPVVAFGRSIRLVN